MASAAVVGNSPLPGGHLVTDLAFSWVGFLFRRGLRGFWGAYDGRSPSTSLVQFVFCSTGFRCIETDRRSVEYCQRTIFYEGITPQK